MPFYRCFIRGEHFPGECIGRTGPYGFYTTRWLQAVNERAAELRAVGMLRKEESFALPANIPKPKDARVFVEEIVRVKNLPRFRGGGATWFAEDDDEAADPDGRDARRPRSAVLRRPLARAGRTR